MNLAVFIQVGAVPGDAVIEDGIEFGAAGAFEIQVNEIINLGPGVNLGGIEIGLEVVQFIGVGFLAEDGGAVIISEGLLNGVGVVFKVEDEDIALLRVRAVQSGQGLNGPDAGQNLVHVHRV